MDMYKDVSDMDDVHRVEKAFSKLESAAAAVIESLSSAEARGRASVVLVRSELNTLRKFLFLIHYRNGGHARQFLESQFDARTAAMVEAYRVQHGLRDARDVWLRNVALLLEDEHWEVRDDERLLWTTRVDYQYNAEKKQLAIYRAPPGVGFVLTENSLGLWEGTSFPAFVREMRPPGTTQGDTHFDWTSVFAVSPRVVVVLRSAFLTKEASLLRQGVPPAQASAHLQMFANQSYFADLPRTPAKTRYCPPLPPGARSFQGYANVADMPADDRRKYEDWTQRFQLCGVPVGSRVHDVFEFAIDSLTTDQAERVNVLMLTHCRETICFLSPAGLLRSIAAFEEDIMLSRPPNKRSYRGLKHQLRVAIEMADAPPATDVALAPADKVAAPAHKASSSPAGSYDLRPSEQNVPHPTSIHSPNAGRTQASYSAPPEQHAAVVSSSVSASPRNSNDGGRGAVSAGAFTKETLPGLRGAFKRKSPRAENPSSPQGHPSAVSLPGGSERDVSSTAGATSPASPHMYDAPESVSASEDEPGPPAQLENTPEDDDTESSSSSSLSESEDEADAAGGLWQSVRGWLPF
jgi:hypothetical protein